MLNHIERAPRATLLCAVASGCLVFCGSAAAQTVSDQSAPAPVAPTADTEATTNDIIVTARKRSETAIAVPAAITALGAAQLQKYDTQDLVSLSTQVPGLIIQPIPSGGGGAVALRGISSSATNPSIDQAVSFNVDGVQISSANIMRLSQIDLQQVEVLKGPQALFFGKNSPAGVISVRTADPTDHFQFEGKTSYEFNAREGDISVAAGGPLTDTLGIRVVAYGQAMRGYFRNEAQATPGFSLGALHPYGPQSGQFYFRGTVLFKPTSNFSARIKYGYAMLDGDGTPADTAQRIYCPNGTPQLNGFPLGNQNCRVDNVYYSGRLNPAITRQVPGGAFGQDGIKSRSRLGSIELNYEPVRDISLTSITGYYKQFDETYANFTYQSGNPLSAGYTADRREISQELRIATSREDWPVNFTAGGFYQDTDFANSIVTAIDAFALGRAPAPGIAAVPGVNRFTVDGTAYSVFGQAIWKIADTLELAGGARYSHETKRFTGSALAGPISPFVSRVAFNDTSPEVTLSFRPSSRLTIFAAYRNGFTSGGFNTGTTPTALTGQRVDYRPETAQGFEAGLKTIQGAFRLNVTAYRYIYKDLQLSTFDPSTLGQRVINAASAKVQGIEGDATWETPLDGFALRGSLNYNNARYRQFLVGCYVGQTIADGCNLNLVGGAFTQQNFAGRQLLLAPDLTGSGGFSYDTVLGDLKFGINSDVNYSSGFFAQLEEAPFVRQKRFATVDAAIRVGRDDDLWQLALIGRNLTEVYRSRFVSQVSLTGVASRTGTATPGGISDYSGQINRGREVRLQLTVKLK